MLVDPDATEVGPVSVTVGMLVLLLWHEVQVEPLFPENPEIPPLLAFAVEGEHMGSSTNTAIHNHVTRLVDVLSLDFWTTGVGVAVQQLDRNFLGSTVASFLQPSHGAYEGGGGRRMQFCRALLPQ